MRRDSFYPPTQNYVEGRQQMRQRQVKWSRWEDIDDYVPYFHDWEIGDTIVALEDLEFSWGWTVQKGEHVKLRDNTSLLQLDIRNIREWFKKVKD